MKMLNRLIVLLFIFSGCSSSQPVHNNISNYQKWSGTLSLETLTFETGECLKMPSVTKYFSIYSDPQKNTEKFGIIIKVLLHTLFFHETYYGQELNVTYKNNDRYWRFQLKNTQDKDFIEASVQTYSEDYDNDSCNIVYGGNLKGTN